jgi:ligand-binding sensor domain-containing protein
MWFGTTAGINKLNAAQNLWLPYTNSNGLINNSVVTMAQDVAGNMWFGTSTGLSKFNGNATWTNYTTNTANIYAFRTAAGKLGLIRLTYVTGVNGYVALEIKVQK